MVACDSCTNHFGTKFIAQQPVQREDYIDQGCELSTCPCELQKDHYELLLNLVSFSRLCFFSIFFFFFQREREIREGCLCSLFTVLFFHAWLVCQKEKKNLKLTRKDVRWSQIDIGHEMVDPLFLLVSELTIIVAIARYIQRMWKKV